MEQTTYNTQRQELLRRAAQGEDVTKAIDKLDADHAAGKRAAALSADIEQTRQVLAQEEAQKHLQHAHDDAVVVFRELQAKATAAADHFEALFEQTTAAMQAWQIAQQAAQEQAAQVHHLRMQGARPVSMPVAFGGQPYSVHLLRNAGDKHHQQILYTGKLPRIV
jgi:hypothetical protein